MELTRHDFDQTVYGKNAEEIETAARTAVLTYFGEDPDVEWSVDADAQLDLAGRVIGYIGRVRATKP